MDLPLARSGVEGLTPSHIRERMVENGWGCLPIVAHDGEGKGAGKRPLITRWQEFATFEGPSPTRAQLAAWGRAGDRAPGTGVPCGSVIGIDLDVADPRLAGELSAIAFDCFGPTPFIRTGRSPKVLLVYRAAGPIDSEAFKALDRSGDGVDILAEGRQFVAFGIHPTTLRPYRWTGAESPLTASPDAAPEITAEQVEAFLGLVRAALPLSKGGGTRGPSGASAEIVRDEAGLVVDGREAFLTRVVHRVGCDLARTGGLPTVEQLAAGAWAVFEKEARLTVAGRSWALRDAETKAAAWIDRVRRKIISLPPRAPESVEASYPDERLPLPEAERAVSSVIAEFFARHAPAYRNANAAYDLNPAPLKLAPVPEHWLVRSEAGIGKTAAAVSAIARARSLRVVYAVPTLRLGDELAQRFRAAGVDARVYRGREAPDPDRGGEPMCGNLAAVADAREGGAWSVFGAVCERRVGGSLQRCPFFAECGHVAQRTATPAVWVVPHVILFRRRPAFMAPPDALVIDEAFLGKAIPARAARLTVDEIEQAGLPIAAADQHSIKAARAALVAALRAGADGSVQAAALRTAGITSRLAREAAGVEAGRQTDPGITPAMSPAARKRAAAASAGVNKEVRRHAALWREIATFLDLDVEASGRLRLAFDKETRARVIERRSLRRIDLSWHAPVLALDATAPAPELLARVLDGPVTLKATIAARWSEHGHVRQIVGAPVSATKLGIVAGRPDRGARAITEIRRFIADRASCAWPRRVAVVAQKLAIERIEAESLPPNVDTGNFGALAGLDRWSQHAGLIVVGRPLPDPLAMEIAAGVLTGSPVEHTLTGDERTRWYDRKPGGLRVAGAPYRVERPVHPDAVADAFREQSCEAELIQALGRIRPLRRSEREAFFVDLLADLPLPISIDEVAQWEDVRPGAWADMAGAGVVLSTRMAILAAFPEAGLTEDQARAAAAGFPGERCLENYPQHLSPGNRPRPARFKEPGRGKKVVEAIILPNGPWSGADEFLAWLEARVGKVERVEVDRLRMTDGDRRRLARIVQDTTALTFLDAVARVASDTTASLAGTGSTAVAIYLSVSLTAPKLAVPKIDWPRLVGLRMPAYASGLGDSSESGGKEEPVG